MREEILERQIKSGISPKGTQLTEKPSAIPNWDDLTEGEKTLFKHLNKFRANKVISYIRLIAVQI